MVISTCTFLESRSTPDHDITSPKNRMHLSLLSFRFGPPAQPWPFVECSIMVSALVVKHCNKNVIHITKYTGQSLEQLVCFSLKPISSQCHTKWQSYVYVSTKRTREVVRYSDCSSRFILWYLELVCMSMGI